MNSSKRKNNPTLSRKKGAVIAETGAAMAVLLPVVVTITFVILEVSYAYTIKNCLSEGARQAARTLSIAYGKDKSIADDRSKQDSLAFDKVRLNNMISDSRQFDDATFDTAADPPVVTVRVRYASGSYGLPTFPNPDPLNLGPSFVIASTSTYRLQ